jgi:lantibiotic modifying enzyme
MSEWTVLLTGELAERAERVVTGIARQLPGLEPRVGEPEFRRACLATGAAGQAVFFHQLALTLGSERERAAAGDQAEDLLEDAVAALTSAPMGPSLFQGFSGIAWAAEHLRGGDEEDRNQEIDALLLDRVAVAPWPATLDLVDGLAGIAVYAAERLPAPAAAAILEALAVRLREAAEPVAEGLTWRFRAAPGWESPPLYDLGLAHGVSGLVGALALLHGTVGERGRPAVAEMLDQSVSWLLAHEVAAHDTAETSRFPGLIHADRPAAPSRLAWCYGDLAVAVALFAAARARGHDGWRQRSIDIAAQAALRSLTSSKVKDSGLCHGAFGVAHLLNRLYQSTGDHRLRQGALRWFREGFALERPGEAIAGFPAWWVDRAAGGSWAPDASLLTGAAGTALALLAGISTVEPAWDRILMASFAASLSTEP